MNTESLRAAVREVPDYPKPGILFRDITPLLRDGSLFATAIDRLFTLAQPLAPQAVVGIESRGFVFGAPLALRLGVGFVPVRKPGKLPAERLTETYSLEYGEGQLEMHADAFPTPGRVLIVDDVLATGGTAAASARLVERAGGTVAGLLFLIELATLGGRSQLTGRRVESLLLY